MMKKLFALLICLFLLTGAAAEPAHSAVDQVNRLFDDLVAGRLAAANASSVQAWLDGELSRTAGTGAEWYVFSLCQSGVYDYTIYQQSLRTYLQQNTVYSASSRQKFALVLKATGAEDDYIAEVMETTLGQQGVMSWIYGLHLLNNGCTSTSITSEDAISALLSLQLSDGGWVVSGQFSDPDVTAMALQSLAPHAKAHTDAIDRALTMLSERQLADGSFASYGIPSAESTAQVIVALCALGIDPLTDARFIKNGCTPLDALLLYRLPDNSFSHNQGGNANHNATVQALQALLALRRLYNGQKSLYLLSERPAQHTAPDAMGYKPVAALIVLLLAAVVCLVLLILKKRHPKNFIFVFMLAALAIALVYSLDFQSAESYYSGQKAQKSNPIGMVTLTIRCDTVTEKSTAAFIPRDGVILPVTDFAIAEGDTVYTILTEAAQAYHIPLENSGAPGMAYITGISHLHEMAFGDLSGWMYFVNTQSPGVGCDQYTLKDGDAIEWLYSCEMGADLQ